MSIGRVSLPWIKQGVDTFKQRISKYAKFSLKELPDIRNAGSLPLSRIKEEEGKLILNEITQSDLICILDEKGKEFTSREFSHWVQKQLASGRKRLVFIIGGPFGFSQDVYDRGDYKLSLSKMTFTHEMAKLFFTEQIYRAFTILNNEPYHHD